MVTGGIQKIAEYDGRSIAAAIGCQRKNFYSLISSHLSFLD